MSIRTFIRILSLALGLVLASPLAWSAVGPLPALAGAGLLVLTVGYLALSAGGGDLTRWHMRYHLRSGDDLNRLEEVLRYLAAQTGHLVVEASAQGLVLELPPAFDRYVEAHLPQALPELRLTRVGQGDEGAARGSSFFCLGAPSSDALRWATEGEGRQVRLHVHQGPYATLIARTDGVRPLGRWLRIPRSLGQRLPVWDELSAGVPLSCLFPATDESAVYASRSRLLDLAPPDDYTPDLAGRSLGLSTAGRPLTLGRDLPLLTVGAPPSFLVRQALDDLQSGRTVVVVSPQRRVLERITQQVGKTAVHWLDPQDSRKSARLAIVTAEEWAATDVETLVQLLQAFIAQLGLDVHLPFVGDFARRPPVQPQDLPPLVQARPLGLDPARPVLGRQGPEARPPPVPERRGHCPGGGRFWPARLGQDPGRDPAGHRRPDGQRPPAGGPQSQPAGGQLRPQPVRLGDRRGRRPLHGRRVAVRGPRSGRPLLGQGRRQPTGRLRPPLPQLRPGAGGVGRPVRYGQGAGSQQDPRRCRSGGRFHRLDAHPGAQAGPEHHGRGLQRRPGSLG